MPIQCHPAGPIFHGFGPAVIDHQMTGVTSSMSPVHPYAAVHIHPGPAIPLVSYATMLKSFYLKF